MNRKKMKRLSGFITTALILALVVFLIGCGEEETSETGRTIDSEMGQASGEDTAQPEMLIGERVKPTENSPEDFTESLEEGRPVLVFFYMLERDEKPHDDFEVRNSITTLESRYKGQMDFYTYLYSDGERYKDLTALLMVDTTPTVVMIDSDSRVIKAWTGYVDEKSLEQGILETLSS